MLISTKVLKPELEDRSEIRRLRKGCIELCPMLRMPGVDRLSHSHCRWVSFVAPKVIAHTVKAMLNPVVPVSTVHDRTRDHGSPVTICLARPFHVLNHALPSLQFYPHSLLSSRTSTSNSSITPRTTPRLSMKPFTATLSMRFVVAL